MARKYCILSTLIAIVILICAAPATADADLLVGPGTITADSPLTPGRSYTLPAHEITNNSFRALNMTVSVSGHRDQSRELPPVEWFSIDREKLVVQARSAENVQVEVNLPLDAPAGRYKVWFLFDAMPIGGEGLVTAVAIQASFTFEVMDAGQSAAAGNTPGGGAGKVTPFLWAGAGLALAAALGLGGQMICQRRAAAQSGKQA